MTETEQEHLHTQIAELREQIADLKRRQIEHEGVPDDPIQEALDADKENQEETDRGGGMNICGWARGKDGMWTKGGTGLPSGDPVLGLAEETVNLLHAWMIAASEGFPYKQLSTLREATRSVLGVCQIEPWQEAKSLTVRERLAKMCNVKEVLVLAEEIDALRQEIRK